MLGEPLANVLPAVTARAAARGRSSSCSCARSRHMDASFVARRPSRVYSWRKMSGWEEQLEMLEPHARAGAPVDPEALVAMKKSFDIVQHVNIHEDIPGLLRVLMRHASGSRADVCLRGATVTSWRLSNGSDVLFIRPDTALEEGQPISGGIPILFPLTSESASASAAPSPPGFASSQDWEVVETGLTPQKDEPFVKLRLRDSPKTRALWKHSFELQYTVTLGVKQLGLHLSVCNTGKTNMEFCTSLHTHIGVSDLASGSVKLLGLQGARYADDKQLLQVSSADLPKWPSPLLRITGHNDMVFLESKRVAVEVGSGCSVFVENTAGFEDYGVLNTWKGDDMYYRNFICVSSARIGKPVKLAPGNTWEGVASLFVRDVLLSRSIPGEEEDSRDAPLIAPYRG